MAPSSQIEPEENTVPNIEINYHFKSSFGKDPAVCNVAEGEIAVRDDTNDDIFEMQPARKII